MIKTVNLFGEDGIAIYLTPELDICNAAEFGFQSARCQTELRRFPKMTAKEGKKFVGWVAVDGGADKTSDAIHGVGQCCDDRYAAAQVAERDGYEYVRWAASDGYLYVDRDGSPDVEQ